MKQFISNYISNNLIFIIALSILFILLSVKYKKVRNLVLSIIFFGAFSLVIYKLHILNMVDEKTYLFVCEIIAVIFVSTENIFRFLMDINLKLNDVFNCPLLFVINDYINISSAFSIRVDLSIFTSLILCAFFYPIYYFKRIFNFIEEKFNNNKNLSIKMITLRC